jgi:hypothetical protein
MNLQHLPAAVKRQMTSADLPTTYEAAKKALSACSRLDECKEWSNRMAAIASYARQAKDKSLEEMAIRIRHRAMRRIGEMLSELPSGSRGNRNIPNDRKKAADSIGLTQPDAHRLVRIARVPKHVFDNKVDESPPPSFKQLDPGWSAQLATKVNGDKSSINLYAEVQKALSPLVEIILNKKIDPAMRASEILSLELPPEYLNGLKASVIMIGEWLDEFELRLKTK